jgi:type I restriction enzyme R subunit
LNPDRAIEAAKSMFQNTEPTQEQIKHAAKQLVEAAVQPIAANPAFRNKLIELQRAREQIIDTVSKDRVLSAEFDQTALEAARGTVQSFEKFIAEHRDEITALQILYSRPHRQRLTFAQIKELAASIEKPPRRWTTDILWRAYETLDKSKVRGSGQRILTDLVSLVRFALREDDTLIPFGDSVKQRFDTWLAQQASLGRPFTPEQRQWLELIRDHIATSLSIEVEDFEFSPFNQKGGLGKAHQVFGVELPRILEELNEALAA